MASVYEQFFILKHHGNWSFFEAYNLPIGLRKWFVERLSKHFEEERERARQADAEARSKSRSSR